MNDHNKPKKLPKNQKTGAFDRLINSVNFGRNYVFVSLAVLFSTTFLWALLSAKLQQSNADQLINPYLLQHSDIFRGATFPAAHTFLIKLPLFFLVKIFGYTTATYTGFTVGLVMLTVGGLAAILYKIERRPLVFGTLCLALASVLLLIPAQPHAGGLLPVNMAMLTTRNIEYLVYIGALALIIKSPHLRSWKFWAGMVVMGLLVASDKLFLLLAVGAGLAALVIYALRNRWDLVTLSVKSLVGSVVAGVGAFALLWVTNISHITNVAGSSDSGPYGLVHGAKNLVLGVIYGIAGIFTNFGANPAYDATVVRNIPHQLFSRLTSLSGPAYIINAVVLIAGLVIVGLLVKDSLLIKRGKKDKFDDRSQLSLMLVWSTLAALGVFILSDHYYAVDARYLTIALFAIFIAAASFTSQRLWTSRKVLSIGVVLLLSIALGIVGVARSYQTNNSALANFNQRNEQVAQVLKSHPEDVLVGDYWRVVPTRLASKDTINILPLSNCTQERDELSSTSWQLNLHTHSFAYLLTLDGSLTGFSQCSLKQVIAFYGRPNASVLIAGTLSNPKELVLLYDTGIHNSKPKSAQPAAGPATVLPITLDQLPSTNCVGSSSMNIVAHQDDDLLFMNPDIMRDIADGRCVRTVYVTAGDDGAGAYYWLSREQGSEAAYSKMASASPVWIQRIVKLANNEYVSIANPKGNTKISLVFMHLPDGNINGSGFSLSSNESLQKLGYGAINTINSVDHQSVYTSAQLSSALTDLMYAYRPTDIRTQANYVSKQYPDHSDHMAVGRFVRVAYAQYEKEQFDNEVTIPLKFYIGYPIHALAVNVTGADLDEKAAVFLAYAKYDGNVCHSLAECNKSSAYGFYLDREYQNPY